jgi:hypothetical protein
VGRSSGIRVPTGHGLEQIARSYTPAAENINPQLQGLTFGLGDGLTPKIIPEDFEVIF